MWKTNIRKHTADNKSWRGWKRLRGNTVAQVNQKNVEEQSFFFEDFNVTLNSSPLNDLFFNSYFKPFMLIYIFSNGINTMYTLSSESTSAACEKWTNFFSVIYYGSACPFLWIQPALLSIVRLRYYDTF